MADMNSSRPTPAPYSLEAASAPNDLPSVHIPRSVNAGPNSYAIHGEGDCLWPEIADGDTVIIDPDQQPLPGDFIAIWWKDGTQQPYLKRLVLGLPEPALWNLRGDGQFRLVCEQLNPPKQLGVACNKLAAVHKVIYHVPAEAA